MTHAKAWGRTEKGTPRTMKQFNTKNQVVSIKMQHGMNWTVGCALIMMG